MYNIHSHRVLHLAELSKNNVRAARFYVRTSRLLRYLSNLVVQSFPRNGRTKSKLNVKFHDGTLSTEPEETTLITTTETNSMKEDSDQSDTIKTEDSSSSTVSNLNLMALEESFGGTTRKPVTDLPARKKSGLYFLVDWNSFFEVGEDNKDKINLRFQPKVGDRSRFLPVSVP